MINLSDSFLKITAAKLRSGEPFCLARFPGENNLSFYQNPSLQATSNVDAFLIKGWHTSDEVYYYASSNTSDQNENIKETISQHAIIPGETSFEEYSRNFKSYQDAFKNSVVKKAILSRVKHIEIPSTYNLIAYFSRLEQAHPNALVYMLLHPTEGLWIGATPEILISRKGNQYTTVSLAGTQKIHTEKYHWGEKEIEEQEFVSAHIRNILNKNDITTFKEFGPETAEAGSVAHLKTIFRFERDSELDFLNIADQLHPTPAISGTPVPDAIKLINRIENHPRQLYTGYLGRISAQSVDLYVNLRCMQIFPSTMVLYLGGGITRASELESEWQETEQKAKTLLKQING